MRKADIRSWMLFIGSLIAGATLSAPAATWPPSYPNGAVSCDSGSGRALTATPSNYEAIVPTLRPGDTLTFAAGSYPALNISNLHGIAGSCITLTGPTSGAPAVIHGVSGQNTVQIRNSSYVAVENFTIDNLKLTSVFGIAASGTDTTPVHHILIQGNIIKDFDGGQETDGISTKVIAWGWTIRGNQILSPGTGIYLGNSDGSDPFIGGVIEDNLVLYPVGYCMEIKYQNPRPSISGLSTSATYTIIRHNTFIKNDEPSPDGNRPNLLVGGFPDSGAGALDMYEIYGNFIYHNPRESLFQASGRISLHDNILIGGDHTAVELVSQNLPLVLANVYNNTIYTSENGIEVDSIPAHGGAIVGNLIFAGDPIVGSLPTVSGNIAVSPAEAAYYVNDPTLTLGVMNFYPLAGKAQGSPLNLAPFASDVDYKLDFNGHSKGTLVYRGAYAGSGTNPGWDLRAALQP